MYKKRKIYILKILDKNFLFESYKIKINNRY